MMGVRGIHRWGAQALRTVKLFCLTLQDRLGSLQEIHLVKPIECRPRAYPEVNYALCMIIMPQGRFISVTKVPLWWVVWNVDNEGSSACVRHLCTSLLKFQRTQNCSKIVFFKSLVIPQIMTIQFNPQVITEMFLI